MSFLQDAQAFMQKHPKQEEKTDVLSLATEEQKEKFIPKMRLLYDNATQREIDKALQEAIDRFGTHPEPQAIHDFMRLKLED